MPIKLNGSLARPIGSLVLAITCSVSWANSNEPSQATCDGLREICLSPQAIAAAGLTASDVEFIISRIESQSEARSQFNLTKIEYEAATAALASVLESTGERNELQSRAELDAAMRAVTMSAHNVQEKTRAFRAYVISDLDAEVLRRVAVVLKNQELGIPWAFWSIQWTEAECKDFARAIKLERSGIHSAHVANALAAARLRPEVIEIEAGGAARVAWVKSMLGCGS